MGLEFQHTAARRRLAPSPKPCAPQQKFQHTAARRRLVCIDCQRDQEKYVSTHSRPKAAGLYRLPTRPGKICYTTQPPEGGWSGEKLKDSLKGVSTHSRPKAAGYTVEPPIQQVLVSTHSRPKAAGASLKSLATSGFASLISLNSQEKQKCEYNTAFSVIPTFAIS